MKSPLLVPPPGTGQRSAAKRRSVGATKTIKAAPIDSTQATAALAARVAAIRRAKNLTLKIVADKCGVAASTISKIENEAISPTYGNLLRLAHGLGVEIADLVNEPTATPATARRSICRKGEGVVHSINTHSWELLCTDLAKKKMQPMIGRIYVDSTNHIERLNSHPGEEVLYVVSGEVVLHTEYYEPTRLKAGDCAYIDSQMGHLCLRGSKKDAVIFWVCSELASTEALGERK